MLGTLDKDLTVEDFALSRYSEPHNGLQLVRNRATRLFGYVNRAGKTVIAAQFKWADHFSEGLAAVSSTGTNWQSYPCGYINTTGQLVVPMKYEKARPFHEGLALVQEPKSGILYIDMTGNRVITLDPNLRLAGDFSEQLAPVAKSIPHTPRTKDDYDRWDWRWGFIDKTGKIVVEPQFEAAKYSLRPHFSEGVCALGVDQGKGRLLFGYIDHAGKFVIPPQFKQASDFANARAKVVVGSYEFVPAEWKLASTALEFEGRWEMLDNFARDHELIGMDTKNVMANFGEPERRSGTWTYPLHRGGCGNGRNGLILDMKNNCVVRYRIASGYDSGPEWITAKGQFPGLR